MQRPIMNPSFFEEAHPGGPKRKRWLVLTTLRRVARVLVKALLNTIFFDPFARIRSQGLRIDDGHRLSRLVRGLLYRMAFVPLLLAVAVALIVYAGTHPGQIRSDIDPSSMGIHYDEVTLRTQDGVRLDAWLVPVLSAERVLQDKEKVLRQRMPAVVLLHDYANRRQQMLPLVRPLHEAGFVVLVVGMRGCGTSQSVAQTFGLREAQDVKAAVEMLRRRSYVDPARIALVGVGTGATAAIIAADSDPSIAALVASAPLPDAESVLTRYITPKRDSLSWMRPLCRWAFELGYHVDADDLRLSNYSRRLSQSNTLLVQPHGYSSPLDPILSEQIRDFMVARIQTEQEKTYWPLATGR